MSQWWLLFQLNSNILEFAELRFQKVDFIGARMRTSYRTFVRNFLKILYNDTQYVFLFLV